MVLARRLTKMSYSNPMRTDITVQDAANKFYVWIIQSLSEPSVHQLFKMLGTLEVMLRH